MHFNAMSFALESVQIVRIDSQIRIYVIVSGSIIVPIHLLNERKYYLMIYVKFSLFSFHSPEF